MAADVSPDLGPRVMLILRRYLTLAALSFWQGGFTFYAAVVVPVGQELTSHLEQGFITRRVTFYLNLSGAAALAILAWDLFAPDASRLRRLGRVGLWLFMTGALGYLFVLHDQLDSLLLPAEHRITDIKTFRPGHRVYLWVSTVQWFAALLYLGLSLAAWRAEDQRSETNVPRHDQKPEVG
jgi:hypothetical protein